MTSLLRPAVACSLLAGLLPAAELLRVRVVDPRGAAVPGATVRFRSSGGQAVACRSGLDGVAEAGIAPPAEIQVEADGFEPLRHRVTTPPAGVVLLRLRPATVRTTIQVVAGRSTDGRAASGGDLEIDRAGARTVFDEVEKLVPGVFVTRRGVMGYGIATNGTGGVSIRGIGEQPNTGVLVIVDGRPDYQGLMGHPLPDFYSFSDAGAVSVTLGPASVLYGSNAMGGVIEIKPPRPREGTSTRLSSSVGSYLTGQHRLAHATRSKRFFYSMAAGVLHTAGDRPSSAFRNQEGALSLGYDLSSTWKAALDSRYGHFHVEDPGPASAPLSGSYARVGRGGLSLTLDNAASRTWGYARLYASRGKHFLTDGFRSVDHTLGLRLHQHVALSRAVLLEAGSDVVTYGGRARNIQSAQDYGRHGLTTVAGFSRLQWMAAGRLTLNSGVRYERNPLFGGIVAPEAGASLRLAEGYSVSFEAAGGFRNPTIRELYLFPAPNPSLKPERLWNYQASFVLNPADSISASAALYYADLSDLIITTGRYPALLLANSGRALNRGWDASLRWRPLKRLAVHSGYAYLRSTNLAPYVPRHKWNYAVEWDARRALLHFGGMTLGRRWADLYHSRELGGYTLGTFRLTVPLRSGWDVFATVDNLFNRRYEVVAGYPMPGVNAAGGFSVSF